MHRLEQISRLYHAALARDEAERAAFLRDACGHDDTLRQDIESLLAKEDDGGRFLSTPALEVAAKALAASGRAASGDVTLPEETHSVRLHAGDRLGRYRIERPIGRGGMGAVFLAYDPMLQRRVALKVLNEEFAGAISGPRLLREARNAAALNHPNICAIYEVGEDDATFIAMEYVDGRPLSDQLGEGAMSKEAVLRYGIQAADALAYAHDHGVVHRDFKAANAIVAADGRLRIVDFGLAKRSDQVMEVATGVSSVMAAGVAAGTPYAMAPEQVRGAPTDARTDVWALGVLLFEMAAGAKPFTGATVPELFSSILASAPASPPKGPPVELRAVIDRCLEKEPRRRYQHAREVRDALEAIQAGLVSPWVAWRYYVRRWPGRTAATVLLAIVSGLVALNVGDVRDRLGGNPPPPAPIRLAVLPFQNLTGDPEQDYFSDGMTAEMITQLGRLNPERLGVIARTSAGRYKQTDKPIDEIGRDLNVEYILEGSAFREGDRVRITVQLIQVRDQLQVWSESYERDLAGILAIQHEVARGVTASLALALLPDERIRLANVRRVNPEVYEPYLRGMFYINQFTLEGWERGSAYLRRAIEIDPADPLAYAGLALGYSVVSSHAPFALPPGTGERARAAALQALRLDEGVAEAHAAVAQLRFYQDWDWAGAKQAFRRALELNPNLPEARAHYGWYLDLFGSQEEALAELRRAEQVDPLNPLWIAWQGDLLWIAGDYNRSIELQRRALELDPDFAWALHHLGLAYAASGMYDDAFAAHERAIAVDSSWSWGLGHAYALAGRTDEARKIVAELKQEANPNPWALAHIYAALGEEDDTFEWVRAAYEKHLPFTAWLKGAPFELLDNDPRFQDLRRQMNLPH